MQGAIRGWMRLRDGREPDTTMLMMALDALPPVAFDLGILGWTRRSSSPVTCAAAPQPGWLRSRSTANLGGGMMEEDAMIWDSAGHLVAQSRQLCGVRLPSGRRTTPCPSS